MKSSSPTRINYHILNVNKPAGWTSFDVVKKIRRITRIKKVGHAGTLDPFATGVLLVCTGPATQKISSFMELEKEYEGIIQLGQETDTLDPTGQIVRTAPVPALTDPWLDKIATKFRGEIEQVVPAFSAAKKNGVRLYKLARQGKPVPHITKTVMVRQLELSVLMPGQIRIRVVCGRGTYVRALARDIAQALGTAGYLRSLTRTRIGPFKIQDSLSLEEIERKWKDIVSKSGYENIS